MSQNNTAIVYTGLDVAKLSLQLHFNGRFLNLANDAKGMRKLVVLMNQLLKNDNFQLAN